MTRFLSPTDVAGLLQVPIRTVQALARTGEIPAMKVGRLWRFRESDVQKWIDRQFGKGADYPEIYEKAREIVNEELDRSRTL